MIQQTGLDKILFVGNNGIRARGSRSVGGEAYLAYDSFTRANGALGSTEAAGPLGEVLTPKTWLFTSGVWAVSSNVAVGTPNVGADVIVNGGFDADTNWSKGTGWTIAGGVGVATGAGDDQRLQQAALSAGNFYLVTYTVSGFTAGGIWTEQLGPKRASNATFSEVVLATNTTFSLRTLGVTTLNVDNVSAQPLTRAELFSSVTTSTPNVTADVRVTRTSGYQAGLVLNLDSDTNPQNFVIAFVTTINLNAQARLLKCVAGTFTSVISSDIGYSAGAVLRVVKSGTSYSLYYNGAQVGTTQTISDAGIISNTKHGLFSTSALNSLNDYTLDS